MMREPLPENDPIHILGRQIAILAEKVDVETRTNALLISLKCAIMNMNERQVVAFKASSHGFLAEALADRVIFRANLHERGTEGSRQ